MLDGFRKTLANLGQLAMRVWRRVRSLPEHSWPVWVGFLGTVTILWFLYSSWLHVRARWSWGERLEEAKRSIDAGLPDRAREILASVRTAPDSTRLMGVP